MVRRISRMSIVARILFCSLNCSHEKAKLKMRLRRKGKAMMKAISFLHARKNTFPKEIKIKI